MKGTQGYLFAALVATILWSVMMACQFMSYRIAAGCQPPTNAGRVIADLELAGSSERFLCLIGTGNPADPESVRGHNLRLLRQNTHMDYLFIALYWTTFLLFSLLHRGSRGTAVAATITFTTACDLVENQRLLGAVRAIEQAQVRFLTPSLPSHLKWVFLGLATLALAEMLRHVPGFWRRLLALLMALAGALTLVGSFRPELLLPAMFILLVGLALSLFLYWPWRESGKQQT